MAGVRTKFVVGWLPGKREKVLVDLAGKLLNERQLASRMAARSVNGTNLQVIPNAWAEFVGKGIEILPKLRLIRADTAAAISFRLAGFAACRSIGYSDIFQVRSGAGQGGAIRRARGKGIKILTDHSVAHPAFMKDVLAKEYLLADLRYDMDPNSHLWRLVLKDCEQADLLLVNSDFVKETFVAKGFPADRIRVAYLGVHERYFGLKKEYAIRSQINLLFTGNFEVRKGVRVLLESIRRLRAGGLDLRLNLIGNLTSGATWLRDSDAAFFQHKPFVAPEKLLPALAEADMFVFPTLCEGSSRSAMEAAAAGIPLITTRNCGLPLEDGKSVAYVPPNDTGALVETIAKLAENQRLREALGVEASNLIRKKYTWPLYGRALLEIYKEMVAT